MSAAFFSFVLPLVHVLACLFLIVVVLLQTGKGADMGAVLGGGSQTLFGASGAGNLLTKLTTAMAITFMATSLLIVVGQQQRRSSSLLDRIPQTPPPAAVPEVPPPAAMPEAAAPPLAPSAAANPPANAPTAAAEPNAPAPTAAATQPSLPPVDASQPQDPRLKTSVVIRHATPEGAKPADAAPLAPSAPPAPPAAPAAPAPAAP